MRIHSGLYKRKNALLFVQYSTLLLNKQRYRLLRQSDRTRKSRASVPAVGYTGSSTYRSLIHSFPHPQKSLPLKKGRLFILIQTHYVRSFFLKRVISLPRSVSWLVESHRNPVVAKKAETVSHANSDTFIFGQK